MTLIIALECSDGIVVITDGIVELSDDGESVGRFPTTKGVSLGTVLWTRCGMVGPSDFLRPRIEDVFKDGRPLESAWPELSELFTDDYTKRRRRHESIYGAGDDGALKQHERFHACESCFVGWRDGKAVMLHFAKDGECSSGTEIGAIVMSSPSAQRFVSEMLVRVDMGGTRQERPTVKRALRFAYRVMREAMAGSSGALGEPIGLWILDHRGIIPVPESEYEAWRSEYDSWKSRFDAEFRSISEDWRTRRVPALEHEWLDGIIDSAKT